MGANELYPSYVLYFLISLQKEGLGEAENLLGLTSAWNILQASTKSQYNGER